MCGKTLKVHLFLWMLREFNKCSSSLQPDGVLPACRKMLKTHASGSVRLHGACTRTALPKKTAHAALTQAKAEKAGYFLNVEEQAHLICPGLNSP